MFDFVIQTYNPKRHRYITRTSDPYYGPATSTAQRYAKDGIPARVRVWSVRQQRWITAWEHDPYVSAHPTEREY